MFFFPAILNESVEEIDFFFMDILDIPHHIALMLHNMYGEFVCVPVSLQTQNKTRCIDCREKLSISKSDFLGDFSHYCTPLFPSPRHDNSFSDANINKYMDRFSHYSPFPNNCIPKQIPLATIHLCADDYSRPFIIDLILWARVLPSVGMEVENDTRRSYACRLHRQTTYGRLCYDMIPPTIVQTSSTFEFDREQNPKMEFTVSSAVAVHWHHRITAIH